ncbi:MAG TPA: MarR family transcriptional regulator [Marmoricola sp.]|jgi:DNA-binding MarR family transcriptional regulator|nr:MarR family transcriptional regulator [Marmoricola sp.]
MDAEKAERVDALRGLEHEIGILLRRIRRVIGERAELVEPGLSSSAYFILGTLAEQGPRRASELAELFQLDKGAVSRVVHQLMELGLVVRQPDPLDGRASILIATDGARRRMVEVSELRRRQLQERLDAWDDGELEQFVAQLARYNEALADLDTEAAARRGADAADTSRALGIG